MTPMQRFEIREFGPEGLHMVEHAEPSPGPGQVCLAPRALSLNYRDHLVVAGSYNPKLELPAVPISDAAGEVVAVGPGVESFKVGDRVVTHFVVDWSSGRFGPGYLASTLGTPGPGLAARRVCLPERALAHIPAQMAFDAAATLPIAALTAYSVLVTEGEVGPGDTVLTLGTGGVSIFAVQIAKALGARVLITSSSDEKLARARALGADIGINYVDEPKWHKAVLQATERRGVDVVVETGGIETLGSSLASVVPGGVVGLLGALTGLSGRVDIAPILMKRIRVAGILVDSRARLLDMLALFETHAIEPVISARYPFESLPEALSELARGRHFGKIVIDM